MKYQTVHSYIPWMSQVIDLWHLDSTQVLLRDVAETLAKINRFNGRTPEPYSVAQHAVFAAWLAERAGRSAHEQYEVLHHDDTEAFIGDIIGPLKKCLPFVGYLESQRVRPAIATAFGLAGVEPPYVHEFDRQALLWEQAHLQGRFPVPTGIPLHEVRQYLAPLSWRDAAAEYLLTHDRLLRAM